MHSIKSKNNTTTGKLKITDGSAVGIFTDDGIANVFWCSSLR